MRLVPLFIPLALAPVITAGSARAEVPPATPPDGASSSVAFVGQALAHAERRFEAGGGFDVGFGGRYDPHATLIFGKAGFVQGNGGPATGMILELRGGPRTEACHAWACAAAGLELGYQAFPREDDTYRSDGSTDHDLFLDAAGHLTLGGKLALQLSMGVRGRVTVIEGPIDGVNDGGVAVRGGAALVIRP